MKQQKYDSIIALLREQGLTINSEDSEEMIKEKIQDVLKNEYDTIYTMVSEERKQGKDMFIEGLRLHNVRSKQEIALATMDSKDIKQYLDKILQVKKFLQAPTNR